MTRTRTRLAIVGIVFLVVGAAIPLSPVSDTAAAAEHSFVVEQNGRCYEVSPLSNGEDVRSFYDYRNVENDDGAQRYTYSSYMPDHLTRADTSRLFLYDGPNGVSLVIIHNEVGGDRGDGSAATFRFGGLPSGGDWVVEDDDYSDQDDRFARNRIDWSWYGDRTDGAVFRGLDRDGTAVTIDPAFDERAALYDSPVDRSGDTAAWQFLSGSVGDPSAVSLDMDDRLTIRTGTCEPDETAPNARLDVESGTVGAPVTFDASASADGETGVAEYRWDFDGDGEVDRTTEDATVAHEFGEAGTYEANVTVVDEVGNADRAQATVEIGTDDPPEAAFRVASPETPVEGRQVVLTAGNSTDDTGIESYRWTLGNDTTATGERVAYTPEENGTVPVSLEVVDETGQNATATRQLDIAAADETSPEVAVAANLTAVEAGAPVRFDANASDDRGIAAYEWAFGDGTAATDSGGTATHRYDEAGTYEATVTVTDAADNAATANVTVEVFPEDETPPNAALAAGSNRTKTGTNVTFDANASADGETSVTTYRWDFDGDGEVDRTTEDATVRHAYGSAGNYTATVTAIDRGGNADDATARVEVERDERAKRDEDGGSSGVGDGGGSDSGNGGGGASGGGGGGAANRGPPPILTETETRGPNAGLVDVRNGRAEETIRAALPATAAANATGVAFRELAVNLSRDETHLVVETARTPDDSTAVPPADVTLASLSVGAKYVEPRQVGSVRYAVAIDRSRLDEAGLAPADLTAYRRAGDGWKRVNATVESRGETVRLNVETDGFAPVAVGAERAVTVADADLAASAVAADEPVALNATLRNEGDSAATLAANLTADGEVVATKTVTVPANATVEVTLDAELAPGTHAVGLAGDRLGPVSARVGNVTVAEPTAEVVVADVSVNESSITAGQHVAVTATVENRGSASGERTLSLSLFGEEVAAKQVNLSAGERAEVTFVRRIDAAGNYTAEVGNATAAVSVAEKRDGGESPSPDVPIPGFGVGVSVAALVAALLALRKRN
ncbi:PKD domain-containing protein [Halorussus gelatinilyticus]|uniref:PKD domain-containing protein n=1 Tax=Halorussus gelatinilyticus TaxID=2937524 RepID=A0A8U0IFX3_9EURY|nr:PKD domain-containing protein [Halorussus gelatinilyticus]UPV99882.1 PKD domain-containing protein [Halorussus gelatinilyticus]